MCRADRSDIWARDTEAGYECLAALREISRAVETSNNVAHGGDAAIPRTLQERHACKRELEENGSSEHPPKIPRMVRGRGFTLPNSTHCLCDAKAPIVTSGSPHEIERTFGRGTVPQDSASKKVLNAMTFHVKCSSRLTIPIELRQLGRVSSLECAVI